MKALEPEEYWNGNPRDMRKEDLQFFGMDVVSGMIYEEFSGEIKEQLKEVKKNDRN